MTEKPGLEGVLSGWELPEGTDLLDRIERMVRPALLAGYFGTSFTRFVAGLQYHLGGAQDTQELAGLARLSTLDHVLDVCCFLGGPAVQLAKTVGCRVTGIDVDVNAIAAASRIAQIAGLAGLLEFQVADAANLPFSDGTFTVIWNQGSLDSDERWLKEFDRALSPGGRIAFTFQRKGKSDNRWSLEDLRSLLEKLGYTVTHADDITQRDIDIGWRALDRKLSELEEVFRASLGNDWVQKAHRDFQAEIGKMKAGEYGNARIVATKPGAKQAVLTTDTVRIRLRPATPEDRRMIYDWGNSSDIAPFLHPSGGPVESFETWCDDWKEHYFTDEFPRFGRVFVIESAGEPVGAVAYNDIDRKNRVELDIWMSCEANCGKGFGPAALNALCAYLSGQFGVHTFMMQPSARNPRAIRAYEKAGFIRRPASPEAIAAEWGSVDSYDSVLMIRTEQHATTCPREGEARASPSKE